MDKVDFSLLGEDSGEEILIDGGDSNVSEEDNYFDEIVGALENILMLEEFNDLQNDFCEQHCEVFEDTEEVRFNGDELSRVFMLDGGVRVAVKGVAGGSWCDRVWGRHQLRTLSI